MKLAAIGLFLACSANYTPSGACSIQNPQFTQIEQREAVTGACSNNGQTISCLMIDESQATCSGPAGSFTSGDFEMLISMACGCTGRENDQQDLREQEKNEKLLI